MTIVSAIRIRRRRTVTLAIPTAMTTESEARRHLGRPSVAIRTAAAVADGHTATITSRTIGNANATITGRRRPEGMMDEEAAGPVEVVRTTTAVSDETTLCAVRGRG